jgi:acetyl esterase
MRRFLVALLIAAIALVGTVVAVTVIRGQNDVEVRRDLVYKEVGGQQLRLDAYIPRDDGPHPAVVLVYGGGWVMGSKEDWQAFGAVLAEAGFVAIAMQYRLAPASTFPAQIEDVRDATAWVRQHAAELDVDPTRMAAVGGSAGAQLAALLGTEGEGRWDEGSRVRAVVSWAGPMDLHFASFPPESQGYISAYLGCLPATCDEDVIDDASPITHVDPSDPPMLLANGDVDLLVPPSQAQRMSARLDTVGVPNDFLLVEGAGHDPKLWPGVFEPTMEFLRAQLGVTSIL